MLTKRSLPSPNETWKAASLLTQHYGASARDVASELATASLNSGDGARFLMWARVERALEDFQRAVRGDGEAVN
jgi:hypothetical protein